MSFDLPPLDPAAKPAFETQAACAAWVAALPLNTPVRCQLDLHAQIKLLLRFPLDPQLRLAILDTLWVPIRTVQDHAAQRYAGRAVPLETSLQNAFVLVDGLWLDYARCYLRCVNEVEAAGSSPAVAIQRTLEILYRRQLDHARAHQNLPASHWRLVNQLLEFADRAGVANTAVEDSGRYGNLPVVPLAPYASAMLLQAAGPYGLRNAQLAWTERWSRRWGAKLVLSQQPPADLKSVPLCVDLASDQPSSFRPAAGPGARFLETAELRKSVASRIALLDQGTPPDELHLGKDCTQPETGQQLRRLLQAWCQGGIPRRLERKPGVGGGKLLAGMDTIFDELSGGRSLAAPTELTTTDLRKQREKMAVFGSTRGLKVNIPERERNPQLALEWTVFDEHMTGLRLERSLADEGPSLAVGQLVAVRPLGMRFLMLGSVCWTTVGFEDKLQIGVALLPSPAAAVALKAAGVQASREPMQPGFLLPEMAATKEPETFIIPTGRFRPGRTVEFDDGIATYQVRLLKLVERGLDFERCTYEDMTPE